MREHAKILLAFIRKANERQVMLDAETMGILQEVLGITERDILEIGEILKADMREKHINSPHFAEINTILEAFPKL